MDDHRCPDCGVSMEPVKFGMTDATKPYIRTDEQREGILGKLGLTEKQDVTTVMCPECGLLRFYAETVEEAPY